MVEKLWVDKNRHDARIQEILDIAKQRKVLCKRVSVDSLNRQLPNVKHQGIAAVTRVTPVKDEPTLRNIIDNLEGPAFLLILDGVQDPHNLGACLRTADAAGVHAVIAPKDKSCSLTPAVRKVAAGAADTVPFIQVTNLGRCLKDLKQQGIWLTGTEAEADSELYQADLSGPLALVMGAEGKGLRRLTREYCDSLVRLPMAGQVSSLNVSVATGVVLYEALRQRQHS